MAAGAVFNIIPGSCPPYRHRIKNHEIKYFNELAFNIDNNTKLFELIEKRKYKEVLYGEYNGVTLLKCAINVGNKKIIKYLIENDFNILDYFYVKADLIMLDISFLDIIINKYKHIPYCLSDDIIENNHFDLFKFIYNNYKKYINVSSLQIALRHNNVDISKFLISHGFTVSIDYIKCNIRYTRMYDTFLLFCNSKNDVFESLEIILRMNHNTYDKNEYLKRILNYITKNNITNLGINYNGYTIDNNEYKVLYTHYIAKIKKIISISIIECFILRNVILNPKSIHVKNIINKF
jgi:ankyrin repeat protein